MRAQIHAPPMTPHRYPDTNVLYRSLERSFPLAVRGQGCWITDAEGRTYLDAVGGAFVATVGHGVAELAEEVARQGQLLAYVNGTQFTAEPVEQLASALARHAPPSLSLAFFLTSGSDAVEAALKMARQYWVDAGRPTKHRLLAAAPGYHGNTLLALSASSRASARAPFTPWLAPVIPVPAPYPFRCRCGGAEPLCPSCSGEVLEETILREDPATIAAFIGEPIGGSSTGASVPQASYWSMVREICDRHEILWVADEVLTGMGRTGAWFAIEHYDAVPDLLVLGKGLTGGYAPLAAVMVTRRVGDAIAAGTGHPMHAQTYVNHPLSCAAGLATVGYLERHDLVVRSGALGAILHRTLERVRDHPLVGDVRGRGLLAGIELVRDRATREPFDRGLHLAERCASLGLDHGVVLWPSAGGADGQRGDIIMVAPPFIVSETELEELATRLLKTLSALADEVS